MNELHRVVKPGGRLEIATPHWAYHEHVWGDPTHSRPVHPHTWRHFEQGAPGASDWYTEKRWKLERAQVTSRAAKWPHILKIRGYGAFTHLRDRLPLLARPFTVPAEVTYTLTRLANGAAHPTTHKEAATA